MLSKLQLRLWLLRGSALVVIGACMSANNLAAPLLSSAGKQFIDAEALAHEAGLSVKPLPGTDAVAVCVHDRCAAIDGSMTQQGRLWLPVKALADTLGLVVEPEAAGLSATVSLGSPPATEASAAPKVGSLAPDFRLPRLDGSTVALSDFRGQRVLINSWASW